MTNEEFNNAFDSIFADENSVDLEKASELKDKMSELFTELETAKKDNEFYINKVDDLKRQNRALFLKSAPKVNVPVENPEEPTMTAYEKFNKALEEIGITI